MSMSLTPMKRDQADTAVSRTRARPKRAVSRKRPAAGREPPCVDIATRYCRPALTSSTTWKKAGRAVHAMYQSNEFT